MREDRHIKFDDWLAEEMQDKEFRAEYERLGPGFEVARLRMLRGLTQAELAQRVGTHQSSISRLESGEREPSLSFLRRVVEALDGTESSCCSRGKSCIGQTGRHRYHNHRLVTI